MARSSKSQRREAKRRIAQDKHKQKGHDSGLIRPDEVFEAGPLMVARFGKAILMKNRATPEMHRTIMEKQASLYASVISSINEDVRELVNIVRPLDPLRLLQRAHWNAAHKTVGKFEADLRSEEIYASRAVEYLQAIIVSSPQSAGLVTEVDDDTWKRIEDLYTSIYNGIHRFFQVQGARDYVENANYNPEVSMLRFHAQSVWCFVRGDRFIPLAAAHLRDLLSGQDQVLLKAFGVQADALVVGYEAIRRSLTQGIRDAFQELDAARKTFSENAASSEVQDAVRARLNGLFVGLDLFDVQRMTGWPDELVSELSLAPGEDSDFLAEGDFAGWPLRTSPMYERPLLRVDGGYYCFDFFTFSDRFYRSIQRALVRRLPGLAHQWKLSQQEITESVPLALLSRILTKCKSYRSLFYQWPPTSSARRNWCELDGLILFEDALIACEVRGGAFTYSDPCRDFDAHVVSAQNLLGKPVAQLHRFLEYLHSADSVPLYRKLDDGGYELVITISHKTLFSESLMCITLDNISDLAAQLEYLDSIGIHTDSAPIFALSIDDLRAYSELFREPIQFIHFLEQRKKAVLSPKLRLFDEMDHFGLYLEHNHYVTHAEDFPSDLPPHWSGYSTPIDEYFAAVQLGESDAEPPRQPVPARLLEIVTVLGQQGGAECCRIGCYLLDQDLKSRNGLADAISTTLARQASDGQRRPLSTSGDVKITAFILQPGVGKLEDWEEYAYSMMFYRGDAYRLVLVLSYDESLALRHAETRFFRAVDKTDTERVRLTTLGRERADMLFKYHIAQNGGVKPRKSDPCPCGSGLVFSACHRARSMTKGIRRHM